MAGSDLLDDPEAVSGHVRQLRLPTLVGPPHARGDVPRDRGRSLRAEQSDGQLAHGLAGFSSTLLGLYPSALPGGGVTAAALRRGGACLVGGGALRGLQAVEIPTLGFLSDHQLPWRRLQNCWNGVRDHRRLHVSCQQMPRFPYQHLLTQKRVHSSPIKSFLEKLNEDL